MAKISITLIKSLNGRIANQRRMPKLSALRKSARPSCVRIPPPYAVASIRFRILLK